MDLGSPVLPLTGEAFEENEEAAHGRRRLLRLVREVTPGWTPAPAAAVTFTPPPPAPRRAPARAAAAPVRKVPPPLPEPSSASDDH
jgi:hypothetical protein